ncbi:MAG: formate--tetrahydrofolate ligase, partial [Kangiellaceae bacterium]|nr:formate--tetrahydrofolate ligase [Kangiellaceae bacterium]
PMRANTKPHLSDIEIARAAKMQPIQEIADKLGIPEEHIISYGKYRAKVERKYLEAKTESNSGSKLGKLILIAGITPTKAGEGKTTTSVGLGDGLNRIGKSVAICLREPSLGPCFGMKGGAAGGGQAQVVPMEEINLHFNGDFHAIGAAHNLLSAMIDNHIYWGNELKIDSRKISWGRVMDMNDRALRQTTAGLGGVFNGFPRTDHFDITVASEIMAIFCLANNLEDLQQRIGEIIIAESLDGKPIYARDINAVGAMTALLKDAVQPNLVQTMEGTPCFIHGGPFANIAHGCNSVIATRAALQHADYVVTEAGFGADLGAEKFFDIKMRQSGLKPDLAIIVATIRALKMHGGVEQDVLSSENIEALEKGFSNLKRHVMNTRKFGVPVMVAINRFVADTDAERDYLIELCRKTGIDIVDSNHWEEGSAGSENLARAVVQMIDQQPANFEYLYNSQLSLWAKTHTIAHELYGAEDIIADTKIRKKFSEYQKKYGELPVCIAKTPLSFSTDPLLKGAPSGHVIPIMDLRLSHGARFIVVICGSIMTMPGLPRRPAAENIYVNKNGEIEGLF